MSENQRSKEAREQPLHVSLGEAEQEAWAALLSRLEEHHGEFRRRIREQEKQGSEP